MLKRQRTIGSIVVASSSRLSALALGELQSLQRSVLALIKLGKLVSLSYYALAPLILTNPLQQCKATSLNTSSINQVLRPNIPNANNNNNTNNNEIEEDKEQVVQQQFSQVVALYLYSASIQYTLQRFYFCLQQIATPLVQYLRLCSACITYTYLLYTRFLLLYSRTLPFAFAYSIVVCQLLYSIGQPFYLTLYQR